MKLFTVFLVIVYTTANFRNFPQNSSPHSNCIYRRHRSSTLSPAATLPTDIGQSLRVQQAVHRLCGLVVVVLVCTAQIKWTKCHLHKSMQHHAIAGATEV